MEGTIVVSPGLPEVAPENAESLGFLSELISDSLGRLDSLKRSASTAILDLLEANVRLGWYLEDARHFLRKEGTYVAWIEQEFERHAAIVSLVGVADHCAHCSAVGRPGGFPLLDQIAQRLFTHHRKNHVAHHAIRLGQCGVG